MSTAAPSLWDIRLAAPACGLRRRCCMKCKSGTPNGASRRFALVVAWASLYCWRENDAATARVIKASHSQLFQNLSTGEREIVKRKLFGSLIVMALVVV